MKNQVKNCIQCGNEFIVTASELEKLRSKGFDVPKRCHECRKNKMKSGKDSSNRDHRDRRKAEKSRDEFFF